VAAVSQTDRRSPPRRALGWLRHAVRRAGWAIEDHRLVAEQRRGTLGRAHRSWSGNSAGSNREWWDRYDWTGGGEEWTASAEWKQALIDDVLVPLIPAGAAVLEIGPGAGRWSQVLAAGASRLVLVDVSEEPLLRCRERLAGFDNVSYVHGRGSELPGIADASIDAVWSFDVFVHIAPSDFVAYLDEIARVLRVDGVAAIHHSDGRNRGRLLSRHGWRAPMSRELFVALAEPRGLAVIRQVDTWGEHGEFDLSAYGDAISICRRCRG
jgi:ubiquinone/menaquinone biosynthesis C-methylase UbiE